jgi:hypothetical protein
VGNGTTGTTGSHPGTSSGTGVTGTGNLLAPVTALLGGLQVAPVSGGSKGGTSSSPLAPLTTVLSGLTEGLGNSSHGSSTSTGASSTSSPVAPLTNLVTSLTGTLGGASGGTSLLSPLTSLVGGLTGAASSGSSLSTPLAPKH